MVIEYIYDTSRAKETITKIHIRYGEAILVKEGDCLVHKLAEYEEKISTIRWELIEEKGQYSRKEITNLDYINFVKGNLRNLELGKIDIEMENRGIQGANQEYWKFQHINNVPWEAWGNWRERLKRINRVQGV